MPLHRPSVDVFRTQRPRVQPMQRIDVDRCDLRTIGHRSVSETLYAARLAEKMCDSFFVESILGKVVLAFQ